MAELDIEQYMKGVTHPDDRERIKEAILTAERHTKDLEEKAPKMSYFALREGVDELIALYAAKNILIPDYIERYVHLEELCEEKQRQELEMRERSYEDGEKLRAARDQDE